MPSATVNQSELRYPHLPAEHWKNRASSDINRSKRVAYGCTVEEKNIAHGTRRRREPVTYNVVKVVDTIFSGKELKVKKKVHSVNTLETRASLKDITKSKVNKSSKTKKSNKSNKKNVETENKKTNKKQAADKLKKEQAPEEEQVEEEQTTTKTVSRKATGRRGRNVKTAVEKEEESQEEDLCAPARKAMEKFGGVLSEKTLGQVSATYMKKPVPKAIRQFCALALGTTSNKYQNSKIHEFFKAMQFSAAELVADDWETTVKIAGDDNLIVIGTGETILAAKLGDKSSDFEVILIDDDEAAMTTYGPFKISQVLKGLQIDDTTEDEDM